MSERVSLINEIREGGYEASLITTFNAYLPFYEDVILRHLMGTGVRHNVLLMDASQAALAIERHPPRAAGRFYTLAPIKAPGAFHPKIILLVGSKKGALLVGSHNLTLSGFGYNREMTNVIRYRGDADAEAVDLIGSAWNQVLSWIESQCVPGPVHLLEMVKKVQEFAPWLKRATGGASPDCRVLSSRHGAASLWQQLKDFSGAGPVKRVIVSGAFFDANLSFVEAVQRDLAPQELVVGIDPKTVQFPFVKEVPGVSFVNSSSLGVAEGKDEEKAGYLHAKSLLIERDDHDVLLAVGSANPSAPAWLAPGVSQNVEMMLARKGESAREVAKELGLTALATMPGLKEDDWALVKRNWESEEQTDGDLPAAQILVATGDDNEVRFNLAGTPLPPIVDCEIVTTAGDGPFVRQALREGDEHILSIDGLTSQAAWFRFTVNDRRYTALIQNIKQIDGLSRTGPQRKFNEALDSLTTGMPNLEHFVECIRDMIRITDSIVVPNLTPRPPRETGETATVNGDTGLSVDLAEVESQERLRKQKLRGSDNLGYLLDVLLYNLRDDSSNGMETVLEDRDAMGRSEEEQVGADDEDVAPASQPDVSEDRQPSAPGRNALSVCHSKVEHLISVACDKVEDFKAGRIEMPQFVVVMAGILSALRLLKGLDGKVSWIGAGQTAIPHKLLVKLFNKLVDGAYDGANSSKSIICLDGPNAPLSETDEFARLKGLIVWLAWESNLGFRKAKFNESLEERLARFAANRIYVSTAQLVGGDNDVIAEARQSIGQFSSDGMDWLDELLAVDRMLREALTGDATALGEASPASSDFGFNGRKPELGVRQLLPRSGANVALAFLNSEGRKYLFPANVINAVPFERISSTITHKGRP